VPQAATYEVQGKRRVYIVGPDNKVASTEIQVLPFAADSGYVVRQGLKAGDRIVTRGVASLQTGQLIVPRTQAIAIQATPF
jgi:membrane fusion protein (multidrug efflux system)